MPTRPPRPCLTAGCPELVTDGRCPAHAKEQDLGRRPAWVRTLYSSYRWQKLRDWKRSVNPLCQYCEDEGSVTPATSVDHVIPLEQEPTLAFNAENLRSCCAHHQRSKRRM